MPRNFRKDAIEAFSKIKEEIDEKRGELDFRHSLANYLLKNVLDWGRKKGEGHFEIREREDIRLFDDQNRCVAIIETKNPKIARLSDAHISELKEHLDDYTGIAQCGALTNGHEFRLFEYTSKGELNELVSIDIDAFVQKGAEALSRAEREKVHLLRRLRKDHFVGIVEPEYFKKTVGEIKVEDPKNFEIFIEDLSASLNELTEIMDQFFRFYRKSGSEHYGGKFLRDEAFPMWKGASVGKEEELIEKFCRETAYVFLNRILFTRILEDKGIVQRMISGKEFAQSLLMFGESAYEMVLSQAYKNVEKFYEHFYEFGIFDWWRLPQEKRGMLSSEDTKVQNELEKDLGAVVIRDVLKLLNRFDFRNVGRDLLGDVYQEYLPPAERKRLGEFYTPVEVVRYILNAVGYVPENRIEDKSLLDPACGSGTFLVEAAKRLTKRYEEKLKYPFQPDNAKIIIEGVASNIHGLDINPFACHIAEMNLLFNMIDYLNAVHNKYRDYRLPRFNVCNTDSLMPLEKETAQITEFVTNGRIRTHIKEAKRAKMIKKKQFDFVVGNPPYVRIQLIDHRLLEVYKKEYESAFKNFDLYVIFIEKGMLWLKEEGKFGYICSNQFMNRVYGEKLRSFILNNCSIHQIVDFGRSGVFADVTNYPCILILEKDGPQKMFKCVKVSAPKEGLMDNIVEHIKLNEYGDKNYVIFTIKQKELTQKSWEFAPPDEARILNSIRKNTTPLIKLSKVLLGIQSGKDGLLMGYKMSDLDDKLAEFTPSSSKRARSLTIEKNLLKPILMGRNVRRWEVTWDKRYVIYPHKNVDGEVTVIPKNEMEKKYPHAYEYLNSQKQVLEQRRMYRKSPIELHGEFYSLMYIEPSGEYENVKILTPALTDRNNFALDTENHFFVLGTAGVYGILPQKVDVYCLLSLLNSKVIEYFLKHITPIKMGGFYQYSTKYLEQIPVKLPRTSKEKRTADQLIQKTKHILQLKKQSYEFERKIEKFPDSYSGGQKFEKLVNAAEKCELSKEKYNTKSLLIKPVKKARKVFYKLTLTKDDYILFSFRAVAECVLEQLKRKNKVRIDEIHGLKVPFEKDVVRFMKEFSNDKKKVGEIKEEIEKLDGEIDELVYELYGLNAKDQKLIEEFLKKF
jgi:type I restriction-modification system DNA methylase subunit